MFKKSTSLERLFSRDGESIVRSEDGLLPSRVTRNESVSYRFADGAAEASGGADDEIFEGLVKAATAKVEHPRERRRVKQGYAHRKSRESTRLIL